MNLTRPDAHSHECGKRRTMKTQLALLHAIVIAVIVLMQRVTNRRCEQVGSDERK